MIALRKTMFDPTIFRSMIGPLTIITIFGVVPVRLI